MGRLYERHGIWHADYQDLEGHRYRHTLRTRDRRIAEFRLRRAELELEMSRGAIVHVPPESGKWPVDIHGVPTPCVYFLMGEKTELVKIGTTTDLNSRFANLRDGSPDWLMLLGAMAGTSRDEQMIMRTLSEFRSHGEWFWPEPEVFEAAHRAITWEGPYYEDLVRLLK